MAQKVLIIEDDRNLAESLMDILSIGGYDAHAVTTGREGITYALSEHPDLIILDIRLPDISGYKVYQQLRSDPWGTTARVMILTASESIEDIAKNVDLPLEYVLFKPEVSVESLLAIIRDRVNDSSVTIATEDARQT